jgi:hypothetical protein
MGIGLKNPGLLFPVLQDWGFLCAEPEFEGGIRWCMDDDVHVMGFSSDQLVYGFGVDRKAEIDSVVSGETAGFFEALPEGQRDRLAGGADFQTVVWMQNLKEQSRKSYLNEGIIRWFKINQSREAVEEAMDEILALLVEPPAPDALEAELDRAVGPILEVMGVEYDRMVSEYTEVSARQVELQAQWDTRREAAQSTDSQASFESTPELLALGNALDEVSDQANQLDLDSKVLASNVDDLHAYLQTIKAQAQLRIRLVLVAEQLSYVSLSGQVWSDSAVVLDFEAFPQEETFVTGLLKSLAEEVAVQ